MSPPSVLIVEDEFLIALDVEHALTQAGFEVCGIAASEAEALSCANATPPDLAVVDVGLSQGDGRVVAETLRRLHGTLVLFATSQCRDTKALHATGALACLPKPYIAEHVPQALTALQALAYGERPHKLPDHMFALV